ncbi:putative reverse transcriptase domain-containing protein [Tanacetum coccineum]
MPPKPDLSFSGLEEFVNEPIVSEPTIKKHVVETSEAKASVDKPKYDCDNHHSQFNNKKMVKPAWNNTQRVNHWNFSRMTHPSPTRNMVPKPILMKSCLVSLTTARPVNTAQPRTTVNSGNPQQDLEEKGVIDSGCSRHITGNTLTDESHVLLKVPIKNNMYSVDLKNIVPKGGLTFLFPKAISDESKLWHRRLGHINSKIDKLVKGKSCKRKPALGFMKPFGCPVTILNTIDHLGKFDGKVDEGFLVGYSINSKAFRVFNSRTRIVEENLHIQFSENISNIAESGPNWLFDIDALTKICKKKEGRCLDNLVIRFSKGAYGCILVDTLLPGLTTRLTNEIRRNGAGGSGDQPPTIHTWLERFRKQKPQSFSSATTLVDAKNWIAHFKKIFEVLGCADEFKARSGQQKYERLAGFVGKKAGPLEEQAKHFKWVLCDWILDEIVNTKFTDVAQVANARNMEILRERSSQNNKRHRDGDRIRPTTQDSNQRGYDGRSYDRQGGNNNQKSWQNRACFTFGLTEHMARDCPKNGGNGGRGNGNDNQPANKGRVFYLTKGQTANSLGTVSGTLFLNDRIVFVLFDTGATHSVVSVSFAKHK